MNNIYENALKESTEKTVISYKKHKKQLKATAVSVCLATMIATSIIVPKITTSFNDVKNIFNSERLSSTIVKTIDSESEKTDIISKNTFRTKDSNNFFYDNQGIAKDILKLDASYFDVSIYNTYNNMNYKKNIDDLIQNVITIVKGNKEEYPELYYKLNGINSFEDYLKRLHCVNEDGTISLEKYKQYGTTLENLYSDIMKQNERIETVKK